MNSEKRTAPQAEALALAATLLALLASLYLSLGMGLNACPLCFYQRTFMMGLAGVLGAGRSLRLPLPPGALSLLALPLAVGGLGVAAIHTYLVAAGVLACPAGLFGLGPAPVQSLLGFLVITALLLPGAARAELSVPRVPALGGLAAVGILFAVLGTISSPPAPPYNPKFDASGSRILKACERAQPEPGAAPRVP